MKRCKPNKKKIINQLEKYNKFQIVNSGPNMEALTTSNPNGYMKKRSFKE